MESIKMSDQWTADYVRDLKESRGYITTEAGWQAVVDAHNDALAAEREDHTQRMNSVQDFYSNQLAAERETTLAAQQAAFKEGIRSGELEKQLAAERGTIENLRVEAKQNWRLIEQLQKQIAQLKESLAAERAKPKTTEYAQGWDDHVAAARSQIQTLVDALKGVDIAYQRVPETQELRTCVHRGDFNELGNKIKEARAALAELGK